MYLGRFYLEMVKRVVKPMHLGSDGFCTFEVLGCVFIADDEVCDFGLLVHG
jgi:hypothetical protein